MFTGIIEVVGTICQVQHSGSNSTYAVKSQISAELKVDQSIAHDGVCLTVTEVGPDYHVVTAIKETLERSNLSAWTEGTKVNLERCMLNNGRFDGHIVQGHVDKVGKIESILEEDGSWVFRIDHGESEHVTVEKGSITVNGVSLTCFDSTDDGFSVAIIPYTFEHTNLGLLKSGDQVNLEFDIIGKYVKRLLNR